MSSRTQFVCLIAAATLCAASGDDQTRRQPDSDLSSRLTQQNSDFERMETELANLQAEAQRAKERERNIASHVVAASNRAGMTEHAISRLAAAESLMVLDMETAQVRGQQATQRIAEKQESVARHVRMLYMHGRRQPFQRALLATSLVHWLAARRYVDALARQDANDIKALRNDQTRLDSLRVLYGRQKVTLDTMIVSQRRKREELAGVEAEARRLLRAARSSRRVLEESAAELERQRQASRQRISDYLSSQAPAPPKEPSVFGEGTPPPEQTGFINLRGRLPWPVEGRILARFGRKQDLATKTYTRNRGIDISVPKGTEVLSVGGGQVVMVDWYRGYGSFLIISHGQNYYTLYAHLAEIHVQRNDRIHQGQILGLSGDSGTLGEAKLHFELLGGHQALNPLEWLLPHRSGT